MYDTLATLWAGSFLIMAILVIALAFASAALVLVGPSYTGQATIGLNFREEPATGAKNLSIAVDPAAIVDSAARMVRSRTTASAVVSRLGLDKDHAFARESLVWRIFFNLRSLLGFEQVVVPSNHDLAQAQLMRLVTVTNDPRSYSISISVTAADPEWAASLANAVALEYLRGQLLQQVTEAYAAAERELADSASVYGVRHPEYQSGQTKLEDLRVRLRALREEPFDEVAATRVVGQSFAPARKVMTPSGPRITLVLGLTTLAALGVGAWLALLPWPNKSPRTRRTLFPSWPNGLRRIWPAPAVSSNGPPRSAGLTMLSERTLGSPVTAHQSEDGRPTNDSEGIHDIHDGVTERLRPGEPGAGPISQVGSG